MKYAVVLYDGMADLPLAELGGKTPMMCAKKPLLDGLASKGCVGLVRTVPKGMKPGSDIANMSVMGFDPALYYTGRSPLEALAMGIELSPSDVTLRCNLVTLSDGEKYEEKKMLDYSAGDISTAEAHEFIKAIEEQFGNESFEFHGGVSYRHCLVWHEGKVKGLGLTPPHDISGRKIAPCLSEKDAALPLINLMRESFDFLDRHPLNERRRAKGLRPANSIWLWGEGTKPSLPSFEELYGLKGSVISAVDLLKGIGTAAEMSVPRVEGATGYIDTNFEGKALCAVRELEKNDYVYLHFEAPDECGHRREIQNKIRAIELIDSKVLSILLPALEKYGEYKLLLLPDHPTPISTATHSGEPVPFVLFDSKRSSAFARASVDEESAKETGLFIESGTELMKMLLQTKE